MTTHDASQLLRQHGEAISRFVNTLGRVYPRIYDAEEIAATEPTADGFVVIGEFLEINFYPSTWVDTYRIELNPATGELRESY